MLFAKKSMLIDWKEIWKTHSPYYNKDKNKFELILPNNDSVLFLPGAGFGDGSHPTTNLILENLEGLVENKIVVDVGSGSGVLSLAASKLGAKKIYSMEIDASSIDHMKKNVLINKINNININKIPKQFDIVLINMISSEQKIALSANDYLLKKGTIFLISGILKEEKDIVLKKLNNPTVLELYTQEHWCAIKVVL